MNERRDRGKFLPPSKLIRDMTEGELRRLGNTIGRVVASILPAGSGFVTLYFDESQIGQYVCNRDRASMVKILRETADRLDVKEDVPR